MKHSVIFTVEETANFKVNSDKLKLEIKTSTISESIDVAIIGADIMINSQNPIGGDDLELLIQIVTAHDGNDAVAFSENAIGERESNIRELNQLAMFHPLLDNVETVRYLTHIDNHINAYIRTGITDVVVEKISTDAQNPDGQFFGFLHQVVNEAGNKTYEYFIGKIMGLA